MQQLLRPRALKPGDTVAIAALSSPLEEEELDQYERGVAVLESLGFRVKPAPLVEARRIRWWAAAEPAEVAGELNALFRDPEVAAIWGLVGGKFAFSYLDQIDFDAVAANPKPVVGMSDIAAVLLALHSRTGLVGLHADPVMYGLGEWQTLPDDYRADLAAAYGAVLTSAEPIGRLPSQPTWETWRPGRAEGRLLGGMQHRFLRIQASPFAFAPERFDGAILFVEDYSVPKINFWHDLHVLRLGGILDRIAGLIIGPTDGFLADDYGPVTVREFVLDVVGDRDIPILANVNCGHSGPNIPLPLGVRAALDADARTIELLEAAVS